MQARRCLKTSPRLHHNQSGVTRCTVEETKGVKFTKMVVCTERESLHLGCCPRLEEKLIFVKIRVRKASSLSWFVRTCVQISSTVLETRIFPVLRGSFFGANLAQIASRACGAIFAEELFGGQTRNCEVRRCVHFLGLL